jgi:hypothetical protein
MGVGEGKRTMSVEDIEGKDSHCDDDGIWCDILEGMMLVVRSSPLIDGCGGKGLAGQVAGIRRRAASNRSSSFLLAISSDSRNPLAFLPLRRPTYWSHIFVKTANLSSHVIRTFLPLTFSPAAHASSHSMAEPASSSAADARSSSEEAGQHDRKHHTITHLLPSRGISLNIGGTNTSHGRPAAVKHM